MYQTSLLRRTENIQKTYRKQPVRHSFWHRRLIFCMKDHGPNTPWNFFQFLKNYDFWSTYWFFKILSEFFALYTLLILKVSVDRSKRYRDLKFSIQGLDMINNWALRSFCYILKTTSCFKAKSKMVAQTADVWRISKGNNKNWQTSFEAFLKTLKPYLEAESR